VCPTISIVIPAYNPGKKLLDCLSSIRAQDYPHGLLEVIVVDDCSDTDLSAVVSADFPEVTVLRRNVNGGCDASRQFGIDTASGMVIAATDADCVLSANWARRIAENIEAGAQVVTGPVVHEQGLRAQFIAITQFGHAQGRKSCSAVVFPGCNFAVLKETLDGLSCVTEGLREGGDRLLSWKLKESGCSLRYDPEMVVYHYPSLDLGGFPSRLMRYADVTYRIRAIEPGLPGGRIIRLGPLAPLVLASSRMLRDYQRLAELSASGRIRLSLVLPLALLFPAMRILDAVGMLKVYIERRKEVLAKNKRILLM